MLCTAAKIQQVILQQMQSITCSTILL